MRSLLLKNSWISLFLSLISVAAPPSSLDFNLTRDLVSLNGTPLLAASPQRKVLILDFWASWCAPCKESLPEYEKIKKDFAQKENAVTFAMISLDDEKQEALDFIKINKFNLPFYWDAKKKFAQALDLQAVPAFFILNGKNEVIHSGFGFKKKDPALIREKINFLLQ